VDANELGRLERLVRAAEVRYHGALMSYRRAGETQLWPDRSGELAAAAALTGGHLQFDVRPEAWDTLAPCVLAWALERRGDALSIRASDDDLRRMALLAATGFVRRERYTLQLRRALDGASRPGDAPGFAIRPVRGEDELPAYVALYHQAFGDGPTVESRRRLWEDPSYARELDLVAVTTGGELAAFCLCSMPAAEAADGWVEQMGTHPVFRRRGLARALLREGLARLAERGARTVGLETGGENPARELYEAEGFRLHGRVFRYSR
jgi:mycothiol synthase